MSHLTTVRTQIKCEPCLMQALDNLATTYEAITYEVKEGEIIVRENRWYTTAISVNDFGEVVMTGMDDYPLRNKILSAYTEATVEMQARQLGLSVQKQQGKDGVRYLLSQGNRSVSVQTNSDNTVQVEAHNFQGPHCQQFTQALEGMLGKTENVKHKPEYRMTQRQSQRRTIRQG